MDLKVSEAGFLLGILASFAMVSAFQVSGTSETRAGKIISEDPNLTGSFQPIDEKTNYSVLQSADSVSSFIFRTGYGDHQKTLHINRSSNIPEISLSIKDDPVAGRNLYIETENFNFTPLKVNEEHSKNQGHAHIFVDGNVVARSYSKVFHLYGLDPGNHTIKASLYTNNHSKYMHDEAGISDSKQVKVPGREEPPIHDNWKLTEKTQKQDWTVKGFWTYARPTRLVGTDSQAFIVHPVTESYFKSKNTTASGISQQVRLPKKGSYRAVMKARNAADYITAIKRYCADSKAILEVQSPKKTKRKTAIVSHKTQKITLDISSMAGKTVELKGLGREGADGCGVWKGEFTNIKQLYIRREPSQFFSIIQ